VTVTGRVVPYNSTLWFSVSSKTNEDCIIDPDMFWVPMGVPERLFTM
jgi:hypothetical protein